MLNKELLAETLRNFDLNQNQITAYVTLVTMGSIPASTLAARMSVPRSTAKYTCRQLVNKQLVLETKQHSGTFYTAKKPESLEKLLTTEKEKLAKKEDSIKQIVQELKKLDTTNFSTPKVVYYQGVDGIIEMFEDVLNYKGEILCVMKISKTKPPQIADYIAKRYIPKRIENQNKVKAIFADTPETRAYQKKDQAMNRTSLLVDQKTFPIEICYHIYDNKVAFYSLDEKDVSGVIIENNFIHTTQTSIFNMAWKFAENAQPKKSSSLK